MHSDVSLTSGPGRQANLRRALDRIDDQIESAAQDHDRVLLKPNLVAPRRALACTHVDAVETAIEFFEDHGITEFTVAGSSAHDTEEGFRKYDYYDLQDDHDVEFVNLNQSNYREITLDYEPNPIEVRVAEPLIDDATFLVSLAKLKSHDTVVATLTIKNILMGSLLKDDQANDKRRMHQSYEAINHYLSILADTVYPDLGVIDGYRGMEGNGPVEGDPVESRLAIASLDPLAADYVGLKCMDIDPADVGYLTYLADKGRGAYSDDDITVLGESVSDCVKSYRLHDTVDDQLSWKPGMPAAEAED